MRVAAKGGKGQNLRVGEGEEKIAVLFSTPDTLFFTSSQVFSEKYAPCEVMM